MPRLTKQVLDAAEIREKEYWLHDEEVKRFFVRVMPSGSKLYSIRYVADRKRRMITVGET